MSDAAIEIWLVTTHSRQLLNRIALPEVVSRSLDVLPVKRSLADVEREHIGQVLRECKWNRSAAARVLGISRSTLLTKLKEIRP